LTAARRRLTPYRQGQLDGLCGLYALINALRLLCPRLDEDACERVFCALVKARTRQTTSPLAVIADGLSRRELLKLIDPWQRFAARELGIKLTVKRLKVSEPSLRGIWCSLWEALDGQSVAIIGLDGAERHWTVAYAATERTLRLVDSCGLRMIFRAQCTVGRTQGSRMKPIYAEDRSAICSEIPPFRQVLQGFCTCALPERAQP
jgi:hypothetical protein